MQEARKYAFATEFAADGKILSDGVVVRRLSKEDLEAESALAYERGKKDSIAQAEHDAAKALQSLADAASAILTRLDAESRAMREEAARIAALSARRIAGAALDKFGAARVEAAVEAAMDALRHQPRLLVKLPPALAAELRPRIEHMTQTHAYAGAILVRDEPALNSSEIVIDWSDGVIALDPNETAARIDALVEAALAAADNSTGES